MWKLPLSGENTHGASDTAVTTGEYFLASCEFLSENKFSILKRGIKALSIKSDRYKPVKTVAADQISQINIILEKHGAFYHPMKVRVVLKGKLDFFFVLNGAVSKQGLALIENEYELLSNFDQMRFKSYLPSVYGFDFITAGKGRVGFFLGQWFVGYKEFHISDDDGRRKIVIWESDGSRYYMEMSDSFKIYQEISKILTCCYNLETFDQINSWHHAAGDFIVKQEDGKFHVRLVTVRAYKPLTQLGAGENNQKKYILPALLFFFLDLTIRMRIDRLNGTERRVLLDNAVINAVLRGFISALDEKAAIYDYGDIKSDFFDFAVQFTPEQIVELAEKIVTTCYFDPIEITLIKENLINHCEVLYTGLKNI